MNLFLPDWAPNIHPLIIHFPIALWLIAVLIDCISLVWNELWLRKTTISLYWLATLGALGAFLSGKQAIDLVAIPFQGEVTAGNHSDWGHYTLYFFATYIILRSLILWKQLDKKKWIAIGLVALGLIGVGFITKTADLGAKLVYKYGVGVQKK